MRTVLLRVTTIPNYLMILLLSNAIHTRTDIAQFSPPSTGHHIMQAIITSWRGRGSFLISFQFPQTTTQVRWREARRTIHALPIRVRVRVRVRFFALPSLKPCVWLASPPFPPCCGSFFSFSQKIPSITSICCAVPCRRSLCCCCCVAVLLPRPLSLL